MGGEFVGTRAVHMGDFKRGGVQSGKLQEMGIQVIISSYNHKLLHYLYPNSLKHSSYLAFINS